MSAMRVRPADVEAVSDAAEPLTGAAEDYDAILDLAGKSRFVLLGEASHGTHEFYATRAAITRRLIEERGFTAVAVEADWPDAYRASRYARGLGDDQDADAALGEFRRFPVWMWRNADVRDFLEWLRRVNVARAGDAMRVGFWGLDLYSLRTSIEAVLGYLDTVDPDAAARARARYACFDHGGDPQEYGYATTLGLAKRCEEEAVAQLVDMQRRALEYARRDGRAATEAFFYAEQNARLVQNAERYYRTMFLDHAASWNVRDQHMAETLDALSAHLEAQGVPARIVVWEHNSHLGDARATEMAARGELNVGQLVRERHGGDAALVGFTTYDGTVTAATDWGGDAERKRVRPALPRSYEALFHEVEAPRFVLRLARGDDAARTLAQPRLERAIGVIYRPETERQSHYFTARLPAQFDAVIHIDTTRAVEPFERTSLWEKGEAPETFPFGL